MRTSQYLVPLALGAMAVVVLSLAGCGKGKEPKKPELSKADPPAVYMKDPAFRKALDEKNAARKELLVSREKLFDEMEKRVGEMRAKMAAANGGKVPDDAAVKKELEKDPAWNSLVKRIEDACEAYNDNRKAAIKLVAERIGPRPAEKPAK